MNITDKNSIVEALKAGRVKSMSVSARALQDKRIGEIAALAREKGVGVQVFQPSNDRRRGGERTEEIEALCKPVEYVELEKIIERAAAGGKGAIVLALDHIQDPRNLGAIMRSAAAAKVCGAVIERKRCCDITAVVYETSCGGVEKVPVAKVGNLRQALAELKKQGLWTIGADERARNDCYSTDMNMPLALVLGSEGDGLSRIVRDECDFVVRIPTNHDFPSLNVSTAAAVLLFEARRQKSAGGAPPRGR